VEVVHRNPNEYGKWFARLGPLPKAVVAAEIGLLATHWPIGMPRVRALGGGLHELRIMAHGLRLYFTVEGDTITFVAYGRKDTQDRDIDRARGRMT
jgi:putative addiction module killer protein